MKSEAGAVPDTSKFLQRVFFKVSTQFGFIKDDD